MVVVGGWGLSRNAGRGSWDLCGQSSLRARDVSHFNLSQATVFSWGLWSSSSLVCTCRLYSSSLVLHKNLLGTWVLLLNKSIKEIIKMNGLKKAGVSCMECATKCHTFLASVYRRQWVNEWEPATGMHLKIMGNQPARWSMYELGSNGSAASLNVNARAAPCSRKCYVVCLQLNTALHNAEYIILCQTWGL